MGEGFKEHFRKIVITCPIILALFTLNNTLYSRFSSIFDISNLSNNIRQELWKVHWDLFTQSPIYGHGIETKIDALKTYYAENPSFHSFMGHAHNNFLEILSTLGLVGFLLYVGVFGYLFVFCYRNYKAEESPKKKAIFLGILSAQVVFHTGGMTEATILDTEVIFNFSFLLALGLAISTSNERIRK